jgi:tripartite-type tricarboxylate transporter receptor subunit TctC
MLRRSLVAAAAGVGLARAPAFAQTSVAPRSLRILVGFAPGGGTDVAAHIIKTAFERRTGRHVLIDNRSGDSGTVPATLVRNVGTDASSVAFLASTSLVAALENPDTPRDLLRELAPISLAGTWPMALAVSPKLGVSTLSDYIAWLKAGDDQRLTLGNTASDIFIKALNLTLSRSFGVTLRPRVYRGASLMVNDLQQGTLPAAVSGLVSLLQHHRGGRVRILATTAAERLRVAPTIPTATEYGYRDLTVMEWFMLVAAAGTPQGLVSQLSGQFAATLQDSEVSDQLRQLGVDSRGSTPEEAAERLRAHLGDWRRRLHVLGLTPA